MESNLSVQKDFKKWLIFNESLKNPDHLYHLYQTLARNESLGAFKISRDIAAGESKFHLEQEGNNGLLELSLDEKDAFQQYIKENYFPDKEVEQWYQEKRQQASGGENQQVFDRTYEEENYEWDQIQPHAKEVFYRNFKIGISIIFYVALIVVSIIGGWVVTLPILLWSIPFVFYWLVLRLVGEGIFKGYLRGNFVKVSESQYADIHEIVKEQAGKIKVKMPKVYVTHGHFNAFVVKLLRSKYLVLHSEVVETFLTGDERVIRFVIGHELAHIKRKHLSGNWWLFPSFIIPLLPQAHSRAMELTCDRFGYHFSKKGAVAGLMILTVGKEIAASVKVDQFLKDAQQDGGFWSAFSEIFMRYPHLANRIEELKRYDSLHN